MGEGTAALGEKWLRLPLHRGHGGNALRFVSMLHPGRIIASLHADGRPAVRISDPSQDPRSESGTRVAFPRPAAGFSVLSVRARRPPCHSPRKGFETFRS